MKTTATQFVTKKEELVVDVICDICKKSCKKDHGMEYMELTANWGYFTKDKDLQNWSAQVCEKCVDEKLGFIDFIKEESIDV